MADKRAYRITAKIENVEIRKAEIVEGVIEGKDGREDTTYRYIDLHCDDEDLNRIYLKDKICENINKYERGTVGTFVIDIAAEEEFKKSYKITVKDFIPKKSK